MALGLNNNSRTLIKNFRHLNPTKMKKILKKVLSAVIAILLLSNLSAYSQVTSSLSAQINISKDKVFLNWSTSLDKNLNYFILQRSTDGKNFYNEAMIYPQEGNSGSSKSYSYDDDINDMNSELVYYRLCMLDAKGYSKYSEVVVVGIERNVQQAKMIVYPNSSANEVHIAIPESWQGRKVSYSVYGLNGKIVKAFTNIQAGQTESFDITGTSEGIYIIKVNSGVNSTVIQFIKTK